MFFKKLLRAYLVFKIVTSILLIPAELGATEQSAMISVCFHERTLYLFETSHKIKVFSYSIGVPKRDYYSTLTGKLVEIQINPFWKPTESTKADYFKKKKIVLPDIVLPGYPKNAMGKVKFIFEFDQPIKEPIRIHGTNDPSSIGKKVSRGCIRMKNEDALEMAGILLGIPKEELLKVKGLKRFDMKDRKIKVIIN